VFWIHDIGLVAGRYIRTDISLRGHSNGVFRSIGLGFLIRESNLNVSIFYTGFVVTILRHLTSVISLNISAGATRA
jgi:hypothetical protein